MLKMQMKFMLVLYYDTLFIIAQNVELFSGHTRRKILFSCKEKATNERRYSERTVSCSITN